MERNWVGDEEHLLFYDTQQFKVKISQDWKNSGSYFVEECEKDWDFGYHDRLLSLLAVKRSGLKNKNILEGFLMPDPRQYEWGVNSFWDRQKIPVKIINAHYWNS